MKKIAIVVLVVTILGLSGQVWAQPFTPSMASDSYGIAQGGGNNPAIPTPNDDNDNLSGTLPNGTPNNADINDAINLLLNTNYAHNSDVDFLRFVGPDATWKDLSTTDSTGTYALISLTASNANTLRVYDASTPGTKLDVFGHSFTGFGYTGDGTAAHPFAAALSPLAGGTNFGWNIETVGSDGTFDWDSNPGFNPDGLDHMLTYHLGDLKGKTVWIQVGNNNPVQYTFYDPFLLTWEDKGLQNNGKLGDEDYDDLIYLVDRVQPVPEPMSVMLLGSGLVGLAGLRRKKA